MTRLPALIQAVASQYPDRIALKGLDTQLSYQQMYRAAQALSAQLQDQKIQRVGLCGDNTVAWVLADLACLMAEVVCVPIPVFFSKSQTDHLIQRAGLDALLFSDKAEPAQSIGHGVWLRHLEVAPEAARMPAQTARITFTSGSTGTPKGVCLSNSQMAATALGLGQRLQAVPLPQHLCILPLATLLENIAGVYMHLLLGATVTVVPLGTLGMSGSSGLNVTQLIAGLNRHQPHSVILVPELAAALVSAAEQGQLVTDNFSFLAVGGGRVSPELLARGRAAGLPLYEGYGLSECCSVVALNVPGAERAGTVGQPLEHLQVRVDNDGRILVRGNTHLGYLGDEPEPEVWLDTGDLGALDDDDFLTVNGRAKNLIITSFGRNISPEWLESELVQAAGAVQAVVFGDAEPQPSALLVIQDNREPEQVREVLANLNARLPDYARLQNVYLRRQRFTQQEGHITANGRPVRHQIQTDLPRLMAQATPLFMQFSKP